MYSVMYKLHRIEIVSSTIRKQIYVYHCAEFDLAIDYTREAVPPPGEVYSAWVSELLKEQGLH